MSVEICRKPLSQAMAKFVNKCQLCIAATKRRKTYQGEEILPYYQLYYKAILVELFKVSQRLVYTCIFNNTTFELIQCCIYYASVRYVWICTVVTLYMYRQCMANNNFARTGILYLHIIERGISIEVVQ